MTYAETKTPGGARPGAGRPAGSKNKLPSKSSIFEARLIELVEPQFDAVVRELLRIALNSPRDSERLKAISMLLDRLIGKSPDVLEVTGAAADNAEQLLAAWHEAHS